jgi:hypothetical protein
MIDITKMTPEEVRQLALSAPTRTMPQAVNVQFGSNDIFAALGAEALKIVKAGEAVAQGAPLPDMTVVKAITSRMDVFATILAQMQPKPTATMSDVLSGVESIQNGNGA